MRRVGLPGVVLADPRFHPGVALKRRFALGEAALQQALLQHATHDIRQRRPVYASAFDEMGLAQAFVLRDRDEHSKLPRRDIARPQLGLKHFCRALPGAMLTIFTP